MRDLTEQDCLQVRRELSEPASWPDTLLKAIGETRAAGGLWRFFSASFPENGTKGWNSSWTWKREWQLEAGTFHAFGEDLFGNQLVILPGTGNVHLWNHENGDLVDLLLEPGTLLEAVVQSGLDWIEFYANGSPKIAEQWLGRVPGGSHLHWTTPLILGGEISSQNVSVVERLDHLTGHARLWRQIRGLDPGTVVIRSPKRSP
jgi:hypothetical protein